MKELSIEEKAKAYDKALKVANKYKDTHIMFPSIKKEMFPELAESEDERIRKTLLGYFKDQDAQYTFRGLINQEVIAWLEKQGEHKSIDDVAKEVTKNKDATISFLKSAGIMNENGELADEYKIEQGEQKPIDPVAIMKDYFANTPEEQQEKDWAELKHLNDVGFDIEIPFGAKDSELQEVSYYIPEGFHAEIEGNRVVIKRGEQKPAWSEEEENVRKDLINFVYGVFQSSHTVGAEYERDRYVAYLEKLAKISPVEKKVKVFIPKFSVGDVISNGVWHSSVLEVTENGYVIEGTPTLEIKYKDEDIYELVERKPAWSEEDKYYYDIIQYILNDECVGKTDKENVINWFKSLSSQLQWKPSQGQLECLEYAIEKAEKDWSPLTNNRIYLTLKALKEQLKKL